MTEEQILSKLRSKDPEGLEALMDRYLPYVSTIVWNILGDSMGIQDAEEVASDVFLAAWSQAETIRGDTLKGWLGAVARNQAKSKLRSAQKDLPLEEDVLEFPDERTPAAQTEQAEQRRLIQKAIDQMGEPEREIFLRHYYYAQKVTQIALDLNLNESTVKSKLRRGRMRLKTILQRWGVV